MDTAINNFWNLVAGILCLNPETFARIHTLPLGLFSSILVVLLAGLTFPVKSEMQDRKSLQPGGNFQI